MHRMHHPELLIRTGGERRLSNYILWQVAESELIFTDRLWPDFSRRDFEAAIEQFRRRADPQPAGDGSPLSDEQLARESRETREALSGH